MTLLTPRGACPVRSCPQSGIDLPGHTIVVICSTGWLSKATSKSFGTPKVDVWRVKDGKIIAFFEYYDTAAMAQAAAE